MLDVQYLLMALAAGYRVSDSRFALEGAFVDHIRTLKEMLAPRFDRFVIVGAIMGDEHYGRSKDYLREVDEENENIEFVGLWSDEFSRAKHLGRELLPGVKRLRQLVRDSDLVHAGPNYDVYRPLSLEALRYARSLGKPTISVTDIDNRKSAYMMHKTGRISLKSYLLSKYVYDPIRHVEQRWAAEHCDLVLFKGDSLVEDYGHGRPGVRGMSDPGFSERHVISPEALSTKIEKIRDRSQPIEALYFGRFVEYKGIDHIIQAVARANEGANRVRLHLWGFGSEEARLVALARERLGESAFEVQGAVHYDDAFFASLRRFDLSLAAPLSVDTPRSTWDSIASGVPVLAYDTDFYRGMAKTTGCVAVVEWPSPDAMGDRLREYADDRARVVTLMTGTRDVALDNTQEKWLGRRVSWTNSLLD